MLVAKAQGSDAATLLASQGSVRLGQPDGLRTDIGLPLNLPSSLDLLQLLKV